MCEPHGAPIHVGHLMEISRGDCTPWQQSLMYAPYGLTLSVRVLINRMEQQQDLKEPPCFETRIQMFMDLSQEYLEIIPRFTTSQHMFKTDSAVGKNIRRNLVLFFALARKFVVNKDQVSLSRINDGILEHYGDKLPLAARESLIEDKPFYAALAQEIFDIETLTIQKANGEIANNSQEAYKLLYGRVLHSEYSKWEVAKWDLAYSQLQHATQRVRCLLVSMRSNIIYMHDKGMLPSVKLEKEVWEDLYTAKGKFEGSELVKHAEINLE